MAKLRLLILVALAFSLGCAIYPSNAPGQYTKLVFTVNLNGPIDVTKYYIYGIVMDLSPGVNNPGPVPQQQAIAPVFQQGSQNGMFTGLATNALLILNTANTANPVGIYTFGSTAVDTGGLTVLNDQTGATNDQLPPADPTTNQIPGQLTFTVFLNNLQTTEPQSYQWITFQVLTMNKTTLSGTSGRVFDALGVSPNFTASPWLRINESTTYLTQDISPSGLTNTTTPPNGDPALSIASVRLDVQVP